VREHTGPGVESGRVAELARPPQRAGGEAHRPARSRQPGDQLPDRERGAAPGGRRTSP
jgi:hypothetical protein